LRQLPTIRIPDDAVGGSVIAALLEKTLLAV
jgi:hypothetical protein